MTGRSDGEIIELSKGSRPTSDIIRQKVSTSQLLQTPVERFFMLRVVWMLAFTVTCCGKERRIDFFNKMPETIEVMGKTILTKNVSTFFKLEPEQKGSLVLDEGEFCRFWGRTVPEGALLCDERMPCDPDALYPMATVAEMRIGDSGDDYYVSLRFGFNLPMTITPTDEECPSAGCANPNITSGCHFKRRTGCLSACVVALYPKEGPRAEDSSQLNEEFACCFGGYESAVACGYSDALREACPSAYYAPKFATGTKFSCSGADYTITFGYES